MDYLLKIADFFNVPQEKSEPAPKITTTSKSSTTLTSKSKMSVLVEPAKSDKPIQMTINLKLEKPDIILVEHMDSINTNAIIVNVSIMSTRLLFTPFCVFVIYYYNVIAQKNMIFE